jgi:hypothetical protein
MRNKVVDPELDRKEKPKTLEEEMWSETDITDENLDDIYKRYKFATHEMKEDMEEIEAEVDRIKNEYKTKGRVIIGEKSIKSKI